MRRLFSILLSAFLLLGLAPIANAAAGPALNQDRPSTEFTASPLNLCSENARFQERANGATTAKDIARFERYSKASCGDDGLGRRAVHIAEARPRESAGAPRGSCGCLGSSTTHAEHCSKVRGALDESSGRGARLEEGPEARRASY